MNLIVTILMGSVWAFAQFPGFREKTESERLQKIAKYISKANNYPAEQFYLARYLESEFECGGKTLYVITHADVLNVHPDPAMAPPCQEKGCLVEVLVEDKKSFKPVYGDSLIDFRGVDSATIQQACPDLLVHLHGSFKQNNSANQYIRGRLKFENGRFRLILEPQASL